MFKGFQDTSRSPQFHGFPNINFGMNNEAYGFGGVAFWLDAAYGLNTQTDLASISSWKDRIMNSNWVQTSAANQPRLVASDVNFNNYPSVDMAWLSSRYLDSSIEIASKGTWALVVGAGTIDAKLGILSDISSTSQQMYNGGNANASITGFGIYDNLSPVMVTTIEDTLPHIIVLNASEIAIDGVQVTIGSWPQTVSYDRLGFSTTRNNAIAEILKFDIQLTSAQIITLSNNINSKYAIY